MSKKSLIEKVVEGSAVVDGCMHWKGALVHGRIPVVWFDGKPVNIRSALWKAAGKRLKPGCIVKSSCGEDRCVSPECAVQQKNARGGTTTPLHRAKIAATMQRLRSPLSAQDVEDIRASDEPPEVLARRYDMRADSIVCILSGRRWAPISNPFSGLLGAR